MKSLRNEVAVVTGGAHGLGRELVLQLGNLGVHVAIWDVNEEMGKETLQILIDKGQNGAFFKVDVSDPTDVALATKKTKASMKGPISLIFNNAGIQASKPFLKHSPKDIQRIFSVNVYSQMYVLLELLPELYERNHGHVISTCSIAGLVGTANLTIYCSSKFALSGFMETLLLEQRDLYPLSKVQLTTAYPFALNTGMFKRPFSRFENFIPILEPSSTASKIIDAVRRNEPVVIIPYSLNALRSFSKLLPHRFVLALFDFLNVGVDAD